MAARRTGGLWRSWLGPMGQTRRNEPWWPPPIHRPCPIPPPGTWSPTCLPQLQAPEPSCCSPSESGRGDQVVRVAHVGRAELQAGQTCPRVVPVPGAKRYRPSADIGSWCAALSPFAGIMPVTLLPAPTDEVLKPAESAVLPQTKRSCRSTQERGKKISENKRRTTTDLLAGSSTSGAGMVGALDHAAALSGERGQSSPHLLCRNACLINLSADRGSSSMAPSEWCSSSLFVSSQSHQSPGSSKLTHGHAMLSFPPLAIVVLACIRMGFQ